MARFHIAAWGSDTEPDLDYETDTVPKDLYWKYQYVSVTHLTPITLSMLMDNLYK